VATALQPSLAVCVFAADHPDAGKHDIDIMFEYLPDGRRIFHEDCPKRH
jgi:hypothetical protein